MINYKGVIKSLVGVEVESWEEERKKVEAEFVPWEKFPECQDIFGSNSGDLLESSASVGSRGAAISAALFIKNHNSFNNLLWKTIQDSALFN